MTPTQKSKLDKNVSPNWKPVAGLADRKPGLDWAERLRYWLITMGGLLIAGVGVAVVAYLHSGKVGGGLVGLGLIVFVLGSPSQATRNGYRD